jgi:hypothetical protein
MLNLKRILAMSTVALGLISAGIFSPIGRAAERARSYDLSVTTPVKVGTQMLAAGDYKITLEGSNAIFTKQVNRHDKPTFTAPAKLEAGNAKFDHTTMHLVLDAGQQRISSIELKGSKDLLKLD